MAIVNTDIIEKICFFIATKRIHAKPILQANRVN